MTLSRHNDITTKNMLFVYWKHLFNDVSIWYANYYDSYDHAIHARTMGK